MGKLLILLNYVFFVFSSDVKENRRHIHVTDKKRDIERVCKFWIEPEVEFDSNVGFSKKELNEIKKILQSNITIIHDQLDLFYTHKKVKSIYKNE